MNETKDNNKEAPFKDVEFLSLKSTFIAILIILFIVFSLLLVYSIKSVAISDDINYTFENDVFISNPSFDGNHYNIKNQSLYTGHYNATYSFTYGNLTDWDILNNGNCTGLIINNSHNHKKVLELYDNDIVESSIAQNYLGASLMNGTIEFWIKFSQTNMRFYIDIKDGNGNTIITILVNNDASIDYYDSLGGTGHITGYSSNIWYHYKIIIECEGNTWDFFINKHKYLDDELFRNIDDGNGFTYIRFMTRANGIGIVYIDAIGFSWDDNYSIGQNLIPYQEINPSIKEVDLFTFDYEAWLDNYDVGDDNPSTWLDIESGGDDDSNIALHQTDYSKRRIYMKQSAPDSDDTGIEKEFDIESGIIDLYWSVNLTDINGVNEFCTKVYSYDDTLISDIYFEGSNLMYNYGGSNNLYTSITTNKSYELYLYINYYDNISILEFYIDDVYENTYFIPLIANNKDGLGKIEIFIDVSVASDMECYLDDVGVYVNGSSLSTEFGYLSTNILDDDVWLFTEYNLFNFYVISNSSFHVLKYPYLPDISTVSRINDLDYYNSSEFLNIYNFTHEGGYVCQKPILWIEFYNQIQIFNINITGVKLTDGINDYELIFSHNFVDIQENYFYVDNNHRLYFNVDFNSSRYEGIQATFNIQDVSSTNSTFVFEGKYSGIMASFLAIDYQDYDITYFQMKDYTTTNRYLLPQSKIITTIMINVSDFIPLQDDNYTNHNEGSISGFVYGLQLGFIPNIEFTITTMTLIAGFIPLIVIFLPTMAIYSKFGKQIILPMLILMSIICFVSQLIPLWLFSITLLVCGFLFLIDKRAD